jgi:hypothetical protein
MQCGVLRANPLLDLPGQSRMVRQGSLGLRAEQTARKELPLTTNLSTASRAGFQITLREFFLNEIRVIRARRNSGETKSAI